jgi:hypothetical protein
MQPDKLQSPSLLKDMVTLQKQQNKFAIVEKVFPIFSFPR